MVSFDEKIEYIKLNCDKIDKIDTDSIYLLIRDKIIKNKEFALLTVLKKVIYDINKTTIVNLDEINMIDKSLFFSESSCNIFENNIDILFGPFCKFTYNYNMRKNYKCYLSSFLKKINNDIDYKLVINKSKKKCSISIIKCISYI